MYFADRATPVNQMNVKGNARDPVKGLERGLCRNLAAQGMVPEKGGQKVTPILYI